MNLGVSIHINRTGYLVLIVVFTFLFIYLTSKYNNSEGNNEQLANTVSLKKLLQIAIKAAENGGVEVVSASKYDLQIAIKGKTKEGLEDRITIADKKSHCAMVATIIAAFPSLNLISEENTTNCQINDNLNNNNLEIIDINDEVVPEKDLTVWIDPLDATHEYIQQLHQYVTTMVCVAVKGKPIIGVIHNPFLKNTAWAWVGHGKSSNLMQLEPPSIENEKQVTIIVSMSHPGEVQETLQQKFKDKKLVIKTAAGAGYKVLQVAGGLADAYIHLTKIKKWDICAGNAIINQMGGKMTTKDGDFIDYSNVKNVANEKGLVVTLQDHEYFVRKL